MTTPNPETEQDSVPFYPDHVRTEFYVTLGILGLVLAVGILGVFFPIGLQDPADPMNTPAHVKPEWYFLALYQVLKYIPKTIGAVIPVLAIILVFLWPFFDKKQDSRKAMWIRLVAVIVGLIIFIVMTIWGEVS